MWLMGKIVCGRQPAINRLSARERQDTNRLQLLGFLVARLWLLSVWLCRVGWQTCRGRGSQVVIDRDL
jgi:hypothetical protein